MIPSKYTRLMIQDTASIASILNSRLGLDREDFKLNYDTINFMFNNPCLTIQSTAAIALTTKIRLGLP